MHTYLVRERDFSRWLTLCGYYHEEYIGVPGGVIVGRNTKRERGYYRPASPGTWIISLY